MIIKINGMKWNIEFLNKDDDRLYYEDDYCLGITLFNELKIFLSNDMPCDLCKQTVIHELTHAFLFSYGIHLNTDDEESVCDFVCAYLTKIQRSTRKIMKSYKCEKVR